MKVDGIDPLIMQKIQELTRKKQVEYTQKSNPENRARTRKQPFHWEQGTRGRREQGKLRDEVRLLNEAAAKLGLDLRFQLKPGSGGVLVYLGKVEASGEQLVREIVAEQLPYLMTQLLRMSGVLLDEKG